MTKSITTAVANIQTLVAALSGMRSAPAQPPDSAGAFPFGVSYIGAVEVNQASLTQRTHIFTIITEIHVARKDLPRDVAKLDPYPTAFPDAIWDAPTLSGAVDTVLGVVGQLIPSSWGGVDTLCWQFNTRIKIT